MSSLKITTTTVTSSTIQAIFNKENFYWHAGHFLVRSLKLQISTYLFYDVTHHAALLRSESFICHFLDFARRFAAIFLQTSF